MEEESIKKDKNTKDKILAGSSYLVLFFGIGGMILDVIIHYLSKNKYVKHNAGQAVFLYMLIRILVFGSIFIISVFIVNIPQIFVNSLAYIELGLYLILSIMAFFGKHFNIPLASRLLKA